ncbi:hypothetical protein DdX_18647 [Ditylenchus destructor]|uniref:Uncharacterized protein n=1 Tax=Ditylenchus destructor TaxID=166010 RepID=A0AAD4QY33_9BILA|nr:hypothetical protein DdX_18647 [Ditylenchus destructor]
MSSGSERSIISDNKREEVHTDGSEKSASGKENNSAMMTSDGSSILTHIVHRIKELLAANNQKVIDKLTVLQKNSERVLQTSEYYGEIVREMLDKIDRQSRQIHDLSTEINTMKSAQNDSSYTCTSCRLSKAGNENRMPTLKFKANEHVYSSRNSHIQYQSQTSRGSETVFAQAPLIYERHPQFASDKSVPKQWTSRGSGVYTESDFESDHNDNGSDRGSPIIIVNNRIPMRHGFVRDVNEKRNKKKQRDHGKFNLRG